jgi:8-oxo-dGTP diphosphatase
MPVRAAGGIVIREGSAGGLEVALIYRASHSDWSFPKGKREPGESDLVCARREVEEETGLVCNVVSYVGMTEYVDRRDRPKTVKYWIMEPLEGDFEPTDEVDDMQWVPIALARHVLTYEHDRGLLETVTGSLVVRPLVARA